LAMAVGLARRRGLLSPPVAMAALGVVAVWIAGLALITRTQSSVWHDSETLWRYAIEVDPGCAICMHNLGVSLGRRGEFAEAQALLERAIALRPDQSEFHGNYGPLLIQMGRRSDGITRLHYRLERNPRDVNARVNLGIALVEDGRAAEAVAELEQALRVRPDSVPALTSLGGAPSSGRSRSIRHGPSRTWDWPARISRAAIARPRKSKFPRSSVSTRSSPASSSRRCGRLSLAAIPHTRSAT